MEKMNPAVAHRSLLGPCYHRQPRIPFPLVSKYICANANVLSTLPTLRHTVVQCSEDKSGRLYCPFSLVLVLPVAARLGSVPVLDVGVVVEVVAHFAHLAGLHLSPLLLAS